ncbi:CBS domain-containing protein [Nannocystis sp.]|uniref:CBS domain-containing protein n=1 Tax=Nannocystis sp. TaxID=1962667 RepID=UPI00242A1009|nr:CBS domain-containing protein [Nannocystis sp.]MBK7829050.1 CBS domain-containing protein [Nannocystis sp.]MBK9757555.1 CBS domain-containing protein [Nannocystis sp.]
MLSSTPIVRQFMTPDPVTIDGGLSVADARERLFYTHARHLPVYVGGHLVGILSDRDLARVDTYAGKNPTVEQVCSPNPYVVGPNTPLAEVAQVLADQKFGAALVMQDGQLLGIFTVIDALRALVAQLRPVTASLGPDAPATAEPHHDHGHDPRHDAMMHSQSRHDGVSQAAPGVRVGLDSVGGSIDVRSDAGHRAELRRAATTVTGRDKP